MDMDKTGSVEHLFRITDIEVANSQLDEKIVGIFRFESTGQKKRGPVLLVIAEINGTGYVYDQLIDVVNNEAEQSRNLAIEDTNPVTRFEKIVQNLNNAVARFVEREPTPINWTRVNIFVIELSEGHLCLTGVGQLMNMLLQKQADGAYKTFDLFGSLEQPVDIDPKKLFASIICGDVKIGDILIAGSRNLERLRNELRMKERLTTLPPVTASLEIKQDLERQSIPDDFVATVVACMATDQPKPAPPPPEPPQGKSTASVELLRNTEVSTARNLAPTIAPRNADTTKGEPRAPFVGGPLGLLASARRLFSRENVRDIATKTSLRGMNAGFGTFLTKKRKNLLIGAAAAVFLIFIIGALINHSRNVAAERAAWNSTYDQARGLIDRAQGESVYSEDKARQSLADADVILNKLDISTAERKQSMERIQKDLKDLRVKLQRIVAVVQPTQLFALSPSAAENSLVAPVLFKGSLVTVNKPSKNVEIINLASRSVKEVKLPESADVTSVAPGRESVILGLSDGKLLALDITSNETQLLSIGSGKAQAMTDIATYANRLYRLDAANGQIWRYPSVSGGFGNEQAYLQAVSTNLNDAVSLAVDSNVYVLKSNGQVARFYSGGQDGFSLSPIDPSLQNGNAIWAVGDGTYIAIADATGKRVLLFTKEGKLVAQYTSPLFKGPKDVTVDEKEKKIYVVDGNAVYELPLP
jgi:hypothetical protein